MKKDKKLFISIVIIIIVFIIILIKILDDYKDKKEKPIDTKEFAMAYGSNTNLLALDILKVSDADKNIVLSPSGVGNICKFLTSSGGEKFDNNLLLESNSVYKISMSIWLNNNIEYNKEYLSKWPDNDFFSIKICDFDAPNTLEEINNWQEDFFGDNTLELNKEFNSDEKAVLINLSNYDGVWEKPFDEEQKDIFYGGKEERISYLCGYDRKLRYVESKSNGICAVEIPYKLSDDAKYSCDIITTISRDKSKDELLSISYEELDEMLRELHNEEQIEFTRVAIPRLDFTNEKTDLKGPLCKLGMEKYFDNNSDNFSKLTSAKNLAISDFVSYSSVSMDLDGTKIQNKTEANLTDGIAEEKNIKIDHPYIFIIYNLETNQYAYIGYIANP